MAKKNPRSQLRIKEGLCKISLLNYFKVWNWFFGYFSMIYEATTVLFK